MTRFRSLFLRRMVVSPKENQLELQWGKLEEKLEERGGRDLSNTCSGCATRLGIAVVDVQKGWLPYLMI